jgi:signal peptidase I
MTDSDAASSDEQSPDTPQAVPAVAPVTAPVVDTDTKPEEEEEKGHVLSTIVTLVIVVLAVVLLRTFVVETYSIPSGSMEPTLQPGEHIVVSKLSYHIGTPQRNQVIVFHAPTGNTCLGHVAQDLVKRIIGLPGERISGTGVQPLINGHPISQPYQLGGVVGGPIIKPQTIPPNNYFVMGDNRGDSCDSRYWGTVPRAAIIGKAEFVIWPITQFNRI